MSDSPCLSLQYGRVDEAVSTRAYGKNCSGAQLRRQLLIDHLLEPPARERLLLGADAHLEQLVEQHRWRGGTEALLFDRLEFIAKLAPLIPPPRAHMVRYHGVFAPSRQRP